MKAKLNKSELAIVIIFRLIGISGLFAIPFIFVPFDLMNDIHESMGLGELPDAPVVSYLARSLSAFYALLSVIVLFTSFNIRRYRSLAKLLAIIFTLIGFVLLGIDLNAGMPASWTWSEGPPAIATGLVLLWLQRRIADA